MDRFENPVLRRELKRRIRIAKIIPAMALRYACLGFIYLLVLLSRLGSGLLAFTLAETILVLLFIPGAVCNAFASNAGQSDIRDLAQTRLSSEAILLGKLAGANLYTYATIVLSGLVTCAVSLFHQNLHIWRLVCTNIALLILMFASTVVGLASSILFRRNILASVILVYALILLLIASIIIPSPLIERTLEPETKAAIINIALYANPLIMTSRAFGKVDIMRTDYMYKLADPIVGRGFTYPNWYSVGIIYFCISCFLLIPIFIGFRLIRYPR